MDKKRALITGVTGQDGSYLAEWLLSIGYEVFGAHRVSVTPNLANIESAMRDKSFHFVMADLLDSETLVKAVQVSQPDEVYNLGAISYAPASWHAPSLTMDVNASGVVRLLEAVRRVKPDARFYQASTSEMYGNTQGKRTQNEDTPFVPVHPYGVAKMAAHWAVRDYREQYGMHASCGILFNHESPRRGTQFVTRKITQYVARANFGQVRDKLSLWTLDTTRDWGFAGEYVKAMWGILQQPKPGDFCVGTGVGHSVKDLVQCAFGHANLKWEDFVEVNPPEGFKVDERSNFIADCARAREAFGWEPEVTFEQLVKMMVEHDIEQIDRG